MEINGLPAHPLFVHIPVVLIPLAAICFIVLLARPSWFARYKWALLLITVIGGVGAFLAGMAGESLEGELEKVNGEAYEQAIHNHAEHGDLARIASVLFMLGVIAFVFAPRFLKRDEAADPDGTKNKHRPSWLMPVLGGLTAFVGLWASFALYQAGDSGAKQVWGGEAQEIQRDTSKTGGSSDTKQMTDGDNDDGGSADNDADGD